MGVLSFEKTTLNITHRVIVSMIVAALVFATVLLRLWYLQILRGEYFRDRSENNRMRTLYIQPPRGWILDRNGVELVKNRPAFNIELVSEDSPDPKQTLQRLAQILGDPADSYLSKLTQQIKRRRFEAKLVLKDVTRDIVARVSSRSYELPGIIVSVTPARDYLYGEFAAHVLGYIREISKQQLEDVRFKSYNYMQGDIVGQYGVESKWEFELQGKRGVQGVIVNAAGVRIGQASFESDSPGRNVSLTLDYDVQTAADQALKGKRGAIVALEPNTGEVLAMASAPAFDPNIFGGEMSSAQWSELVTGKEKRLNNRVVQGAYPPGSTFKMVMAAAGLSEGVINENEHIFCPGYFYVGARRFRCHKASGHGSVNLDQALIKSCDVYFYTVGQRLGVDRIYEYATRFGLGLSTGLDLVQENLGLIPSTAWKKAYFRNPEDQKWYPGETPSVAIGQGAVTVTPLQLARSVAALVNGGYLVQPRLIKGIQSQEGKWDIAQLGGSNRATIGVDDKILKVVRRGLEGVVNDPAGTGRRSQLEKSFLVKVAGKTGTAQVVGMESGAKSEHFEDHAWFFGYAPAESPEIVVVALVENGGHGGVAAAPLVRQVLEAFFAKQCRLQNGVCRMDLNKAEEQKKS